jgi:Ca-activated chloride channel family protein
VYERERRQAGAQWASGTLLASVAPDQPRWRRHAPHAAYGFALLAMIVALAKPEKTVAVPDERASIVLATDRSGSMQATDISPDRLRAARVAAQTFVDKVPSRIRIGVVAFNQTAETLQPPTRDHAAARAALARPTPHGGTATGEAISTSLNLIKGTSGKQKPVGAIVLLSDGKSTSGRDATLLAQQAKKLKIPIYTVALGTASGTIQRKLPSGRVVTEAVPPDPTALREIAQISGGKSFATADADQLKAVYEQLGSRVGRKNVQRELTAGFAGGALALLAAGGLMSLHWFRRLA